MHGTGGGETKETCVPCPSASPPAAGGSTAGSAGSSEQGRMGCAVAGSEEICSQRAILVWVTITPPLTSVAVYQLPPHDSQSEKIQRHSLGQCLLWLLPAQVPKPRLLAASRAPQLSQTSSPTISLPCCYAPNPVLGPSHMLLFDPGKLLP